MIQLRQRRGVRLLSMGFLSLLLSCGGGSGGHDSGPTPQPNPQPTPQPNPATSSIRGVITLPGGEFGPQAVRVAGPQEGSVPRLKPQSMASQTIPGEYLVRLRPGFGEEETRTLNLGQSEYRRVYLSRELGIALYRAARPQTAAMTAQALNSLSALPQVQAAEPNTTMQAFRTPDDEFYPLQWHYSAMNLPKAWDITTGKGVAVAVIDSGILRHPDLLPVTLPGLDLVRDATDAGDGDGIDADPTDPAGSYHGSHVAGTIAAASNNGLGVAGVSWGARIVPVRVLGVEGTGSLADIIFGVAWSAGVEIEGLPVNPNPARIINMSLGGKRACGDVEQKVFGALAEAGVVVVVAAGNEEDNAQDYAPANCRNVITVGATGPTNERASYSNYGSRIDIMAPGGDANYSFEVAGKTFPAGVLSVAYDDESRTYGYKFSNGTSMAAPHVSGALALLLSEKPDLTFAEVVSRLKKTARPVQCDVAGGCGAGLLDAAALLSTGAGTTPTPTPTPSRPPISQAPTLVAAFYMLTQGFDMDLSVAEQFQPKSLRPVYNLQGLTPGNYLVAAWQDLNGDEEVDEGEPIGYYPEPLVIGSTARNIGGIDIEMEPYSVEAAGMAVQGFSSGASGPRKPGLQELAEGMEKVARQTPAVQ